MGTTAMPDDGPTVELAIFGTGDPEHIASWYGRLCEEVLGSPIVHAISYIGSVGCVAGIELGDGRTLAVKAYQERWRLDLLALVSAAQGRLAGAGFPCPMPELGPLRFEGVTVTVEQLLSDPGMRVFERGEMEASAAGLADVSRLLRGMDPGPWKGLHAFETPAGALYPEPHSPLFDFTLRTDKEGREGGSGDDEVAWIDELAAAGAAARDLDDAPHTLIHCDWAARNIRIAGSRLVASYDWDTLNACPGSSAVGIAAATWRSTGDPDDPVAPGPEEIEAYLDTYLRCSDDRRRATRTWRTAATGQALWILAYTARCEHALEARCPDIRPRRARDVLAEHHGAFLAAVKSG